MSMIIEQKKLPGIEVIEFTETPDGIVKFVQLIQQEDFGSDKRDTIEVEHAFIPALIKAIGGESELDKFIEYMRDNGLFFNDDWDSIVNKFRQSEKG